MKNLSKRNKILLGVLGVLVVIVAVGLVLGLTGNLPLQGGPLTAYITPQSSQVCPGGTFTLTLEKYGLGTTWKNGEPTLLQEVSHDRTHITLKAISNSGSGWVYVYGRLGNVQIAKAWFVIACP